MNATAEPTYLTKARARRPLPALPASIPTPEVDYTFNTLGAVVTQITINGDTRTFKSGAFADPITDAWTAPFMAELNKADKDAFIAWGCAVHERLVANIADFVKNMSRVQEVRDDLLTGITE